MTIDEQIRDVKLQNDINVEDAKISALFSLKESYWKTNKNNGRSGRKTSHDNSKSRTD